MKMENQEKIEKGKNLVVIVRKIVQTSKTIIKVKPRRVSR